MNTKDMSLSAEKDQTKARPAALIVALALIAIVILVVIWRLQPPAPKGADADPGDFSAQRAYTILQELLVEDEPHPTGSQANERVIQRLIAQFEKLGYEVQVQETVVCKRESGLESICAPVKNILTRLPGEPGNPAVMLVSHHDSQDAAPGAADDSSSVVAMLEIARILKDEALLRNPVFFLITDAEEIGLMGAQGFVDEHPWAQEVGVVINLEARGTSGLSLMFETSDGNAWLVDAFASSADRPVTNSLMYEAYKLLPNDTDFTVFKEAGIAGLNFAYIGHSSHYHTPLDKLANLDLRSLQHHGDNALAVTRQLAMVDLSNPPPSNAGYLDILGFGVVRWPEAWTIPLVALTLILLLISAYLLIRRRTLSIGALLWGVLAALLTLILSILVGIGLTWLISLIAGVSNPWHAYPLATRVAVWAAVLLCGGLLAIGFSRRAGFWGLGLGAWLVWSLLTLLLSLTLVGVAAILLLPVLISAILLLVVTISSLADSPLWREIALIVPLIAAGIIFLPLAYLFEIAMGFEMSPAVTLWLALIVSVLSPFFVVPESQRVIRKRTLFAAGGMAVIATLVALVLPPYSKDNPQWLNLYHYEDRDLGVAYWTAIPSMGDNPEPLLGLYEVDPQTVFPWTEEKFSVAQSAFTQTPEPGLQVISDEFVNANRVVKVLLGSHSGIVETDFLIPVENLLSISVEGKTFGVEKDENDAKFYLFNCFGSLCDGLELTLRFSNANRVETLVATFSHGLPEGGQRFLQARPATAVPSYDGDMTIIVKRFEF